MKTIYTVGLIFLPALSVQANVNTTPRTEIEEIIVTTTKRPENVMTVPASISVLGTHELETLSTKTMQGIADREPGLHLMEAGISTQFRIRGIGSGNSQGFEQSVGLFIDDLSYSRAQMFRLPYFDVQRIEIAKGPQNALHGKNAVAGSIHVINAKPTSNLTGYFKTSYTPMLNGKGVEGAISGAVQDNLNARLAVLFNKEDGYIDNQFKNEDEPNREEKGIRLTFGWGSTDTFLSSLKLERNILDIEGRHTEIIKDQANTDLLTLTGNPALSGIPNSYNNVLSILYAQPNFESELDNKRQADGGEHGYNTSNNVRFSVEKDFKSYSFLSTTGYIDFYYGELCDCDYVPSELIPLFVDEEFKQFSQDFRLTSNTDFKWIAGLYIHDFKQELTDGVSLSPSNVLIPAISNFLSQDPDIGPVLGPMLGASLSNTGSQREFQQDSRLYSAYGEVSFDILDKLELTLSARYSEERKSGRKRIDIINLTTGLPLPSANPAPSLYSSVFGTSNEQFEGHNLTGFRSEHFFDPTVTLTYNATPETMYYLSYKQGSKAGGFDPRSNRTAGFEFSSESVKAFELGYKSTAFDNSEISIIAHYSRYYDLQVSQFDGATGFNVGNANETVVSGLEIGGRYYWNDLIMRANVSYLDFEYTDWTSGNCYQNQVKDGDDINGDGQPDLCDYTGNTGSYVADYSANVGIEYSKSLTFGDLLFSLGASYMGDHDIHPNNDPSIRQDSYTILDTVISLSKDDWKISLIGNNLTDETVIVDAENVPLSELLTGGANTVFGMTSKPRTLQLSLQYNF